ncbi:MAG: VCBS repeat-containing protein, partial [Chloroflexota bacterium]|nr:VCBS repeat-containing protein [Chloroflexota bacterium]
YSDTWVATDALGRTLPDYDDVGGLRADRTVGMFYFLWHGRHGSSTVYDNTQILQANPTNPQYGPVHSFHWWGEPEAGYYLATDPWVIRRNASMLVDAGVDFIYIDVTNAYTYEAEYTALCNVYQQIRSEGGKTPKIAFLTHKNSVATTQKLYDDFYSKDLFSELWFEWDGKPLMLSDLSGHSAEVQNFFTLRYSWAWDAGYDKWQWIDSYPQNYGWHDSSQTPEQIPAAVASHPTSNVGTSYSGGVQPAIDQYGLTATTGQGQHFAEQMQWAVQSDPEVLMVTGWNEWVAQRFLSDGFNRFLGEILPAGETFFVDAYNEEYNRDIEPMKGAHTDNYYYQLVDYIRQYKGVSAPQSPASPQSMTIDGNFAEWGNVGLEFRDTFGDTAHRSWAGWGGNYYTNTTGRNDIITSKVSVDEDNVYFYVETDAAITPSTDSNWMMLFIDADLDSTTGWNGYEFVVNQSVVDGDTSTVRQITAAGVWNTMGEVDYRVAGNKMEISIPRNLIGQVDAEIAMNFHWADNMQSLNDIAEFFINGDSAPNRRFDYHYANTVQTSLRNERDIAVFRPSSGQWFGSHTDPSQGHLSGTVTTQAGPLGGWEATPLVGDVNGDGLDDIVVVEAGGDNFNWTAGHTAYVAGGAGQFSSSKTSTLGSFAAVGGSQTVFLGDVNGDGADDAISVDATFNWSASLSTPGVGLGGGIQQGPVLFGKNDCVPLTGDFNGDNLLDIAYWKAAATGDGDPEDYYDFFIRLTTSSGLGTGAELVGEFGDVGDVPLLGDINGDGRDDVIIIYE